MYRTERASPADKTITGMELRELAAMIADGEISAVEAIDASLERIGRIDKDLHCFREIEADSARRAARAADRQLATGKTPGPLHGIPLAHKDIFYRAGQITTVGSPILRNWVADYDATVIERMNRAGAITAGSLQSAEFAMSPTGFNAQIQAVRNPWHRDYAPGGSSVGSGAAVAARLVYGSLGTDTGGSVRHPAALCGVVGIKPTQGRVSRYGVFPLAESLDCPGVIARTARDAALLLGVVAGQDPHDPSSSSRTVPDYPLILDGDLRGVRIGVPRRYFFDSIDAQIGQCVEQSLQVLQARGALCVGVDVIDMQMVGKLARTVLTVEAAALHANWLRSRPQDYSDQVRARIEPGLAVPQPRYAEAMASRQTVADSFVRTTLSEVDLLHTPCIGVPAPTIEWESAASPEEALHLIDRITRCTRGINYLGLPAISVPCGFVDPGLPVGFQLVARPFGEGLLLKAADAYQRDTEWHLQTPPAGAPERPF